MGSEQPARGSVNEVATRELSKRHRLQVGSISPPAAYRLPTTMSQSASRAVSKSGMRSGGWDRSASITTSRSNRHNRIPSITERDRSRGSWRRVTRRTGRRRASSAATAGLPSSELSSISSNSQAIPLSERAARMRSARRGRLAASRNVGTMMDTARGPGLSRSRGLFGLSVIPVLGGRQDTLIQSVNHILQGDRFPHSLPPGSAGVPPQPYSCQAVFHPRPLPL